MRASVDEAALDEKTQANTNASEKGATEDGHETFHGLVLPTEEEKSTLRRVAGAMPATCYYLCAVEFAERALSMSAGLPERGELLLDLAEELIRKGEFTLAQHYLSRISGADGRVALAVRRAHATLMVEFALEPTTSGTRLTVTESGFAQLPDEWIEASYQGNTEGWKAELGELVAYLDAA